MRHPLKQEEGFTLVEVLVAIALLTIGILGITAAAGVQSRGVASGAAFGQAAVSRANSIATATMLAQARIEEIKNAQYTASADQITAANFPDQAYGAISGFTGFRRTVTIANSTPAAGMKTLTVQVFFRPILETGTGQEEGVSLVTIIAQRP
jgi:prepilin-type N-terminal cleavage/methylation domain-containing protein